MQLEGGGIFFGGGEGGGGFNPFGGGGDNTSAPASTAPQKLDPAYEYYTVQQGDTPAKIAAKYNGVSASDIISLNGIDPSKLRVGQKLKIRKK